MKTKKIVETIKANKDKFGFAKFTYHEVGAEKDRCCVVGLLMNATNERDPTEQMDRYGPENMKKVLGEYDIQYNVTGNFISAPDWSWLTKLNDMYCKDWECMIEELEQPTLREIEVQDPNGIKYDGDGTPVTVQQMKYAPTITDK